MCLGDGWVSFSVLPLTTTGSLGKLQPVSFMPSVALTQHCLVWKLGMRITQELTWRVTETHLSTWWMLTSGLSYHPSLPGYVNAALGRLWKESQLQSRQTFSIKQKKRYTHSLCTQRSMSTTLEGKHIFYLNKLQGGMWTRTYTSEVGIELLIP